MEGYINKELVVIMGCIFPSIAKETFPVSSETTSTIASLFSVRPNADRWRVPSFFSLVTIVDKGRIFAAEII